MPHAMLSNVLPDVYRAHDTSGAQSAFEVNLFVQCSVDISDRQPTAMDSASSVNTTRSGSLTREHGQKQ